MKRGMSRYYNFVYRGHLTEEALSKIENLKQPLLIEYDDEVIAKSLSLHLFDDSLVINSRKMSIVYTAIATLENSVRLLISSTLLEEKGDNWWELCVSEKIRKSAQIMMEDEKKAKWHTQRGLDPINYTTLGQLHNIINANWEYFEPFIHNLEWAKNIFECVERSRNVIMHSGILDDADIERLGIYIRDWNRQIGI